MAIKNLKTIYQIRRDTEANWLLVKDTCVPLEGEPCLTLDGEHKGQMKIGDGVSTWGELKYYVCDAKIPDDVVRFAGIVDELPDPKDYEVGSYCICDGQLYVRDANGWTAPKADAILKVIKIYGDSTSTDTSVEVDGKTYDTMAEAIEALPEGGTLKLTGGIEDTGIQLDKKATLDMNNVAIVDNEKTPISIGVNGQVTLTGNGSVECNKHGSASVESVGELTVENGTYFRTVDEKGNGFYVGLNHGKMTINGGSFSSPGGLSSLIENGYYNYSQGYKAGENAEFPEMIINGGTFVDEYTTIKNDDGGILTVNDGNFYGMIYNVGKIVTINGGYHHTEDGYANVWAKKSNDTVNAAKTVITGGTFECTAKCNIQADADAEVIVSGGKFNCEVPANMIAEGCVQKFENGYYVISKA